MTLRKFIVVNEWAYRHDPVECWEVDGLEVEGHYAEVVAEDYVEKNMWDGSVPEPLDIYLKDVDTGEVICIEVTTEYEVKFYGKVK